MSIFCKHVYKLISIEYAHSYEQSIGSTIIPAIGHNICYVYVVKMKCLKCDKIKAKEVTLDTKI
jgi:hypothetical protein